MALTFQFSRDVNKGVFLHAVKTWLPMEQGVTVDSNVKTAKDISLEDLFKNSVVDYFKNAFEKKTPIDFGDLIKHFGFKSPEAIISFLKLSEVSNLLTDAPLPTILPASLLQKAKTTYTETLRIQGDDPDEARKLSALFPIFEFVKGLSDLEASCLDDNYPTLASAYLNGHSIRTFRDDLRSMGTSELEDKYNGCFSNMLDKVIAPIIHSAETLKAIRPVSNNEAFTAFKASYKELNEKKPDAEESISASYKK